MGGERVKEDVHRARLIRGAEQRQRGIGHVGIGFVDGPRQQIEDGGVVRPEQDAHRRDAPPFVARRLVRGRVAEERVETPPVAEIAEQGAKGGVGSVAIRRGVHDQLARGAAGGLGNAGDSVGKRQTPDIVAFEERNGVGHQTAGRHATPLNLQQVHRERGPHHDCDGGGNGEERFEPGHDHRITLLTAWLPSMARCVPLVSDAPPAA